MSNQNQPIQSAIGGVAEFLDSQQAFFQDPEEPCYAIKNFPGYVVHKPSFTENTEKHLYYVFPVMFKTLFQHFGESDVKQLLHELGWLQKPKRGWVQQLYGKGKDGRRARLGNFLVFEGIAPPRLSADTQNNSESNTNNRSKTMNNTLIPLNFENNIVRIITDEEHPLFVAKDVAVALGYADPTNAIKRFCGEAVKRHPIIDRLGRKQEVRLIEEPDVYRLIFGSKLESAKRFQNWVFEEVLPSIRKTGSYQHNPEAKPLTQSETIRYHNLYLKLLEKFEKTESQVMRQGIYQSLSSVANELGLMLVSFEKLDAGLK